MRLPKSVPVKEGHQESVEQAILGAASIARGSLGWSGQAYIFVECGFDKHFLKKRAKRWGNKRQRRKRMKAALKQVFLQNIVQHLDCSKAVY